jgi:hypothetical protein
MNLKTTICNKCLLNFTPEEYNTHKDYCNDYRQSLRASNKFQDYSSTSDFNKLNSNNYFSTFKAQGKKEESEGSYINLNEGAITFGARNNKPSSDGLGSKIVPPAIRKKEENDFSLSLFGIRNTVFEYNSYLSCVIHALWNMKKLREYILYDMSINDKDNRQSLLLVLQNLFKKINTVIGRNREIIAIDDVRLALNETFQSRRKFLIDYPDDPVDAYFAIINSLHALFIVIFINLYRKLT